MRGEKRDIPAMKVADDGSSMEKGLHVNINTISFQSSRLQRVATKDVILATFADFWTNSQDSEFVLFWFCTHKIVKNSNKNITTIMKIRHPF